MSEDRKTQQIDIVTGLLMGAGAVLFVFLQLSYKAGSDGGTVVVWNDELLLYGAMGALPGWILNGVLKRRFSPRLTVNARPGSRAVGSAARSWRRRASGVPTVERSPVRGRPTTALGKAVSVGRRLAHRQQASRLRTRTRS